MIQNGIPLLNQEGMLVNGYILGSMIRVKYIPEILYMMCTGYRC